MFKLHILLNFAIQPPVRKPAIDCHFASDTSGCKREQASAILFVAVVYGPLKASAAQQHGHADTTAHTYGHDADADGTQQQCDAASSAAGAAADAVVSPQEPAVQHNRGSSGHRAAENEQREQARARQVCRQRWCVTIFVRVCCAPCRIRSIAASWWLQQICLVVFNSGADHICVLKQACQRTRVCSASSRSQRSGWGGERSS